MNLTWVETGDTDDPASRLSESGPGLTIEQCSMHVEAYAVHVDATGCQVADHEWGEEALNGIECIDAGDGPRETFERDGRSYIVVAYPFCD